MTAVKQYLAGNAAAVRRFKSSTTKRKSQAQHQSVYRKRRQAGLQPVDKPWDYLCCGEVKDMAWKAYRVAAWHLRQAMFEGNYSQRELREMFAESLGEMFKDALAAHAVNEGGCWPVDGSTPPYRNYPVIWDSHCDEVSKTWRPEYPVYPPVKGVA
jgi:hypothetical protein